MIVPGLDPNVSGRLGARLGQGGADVARNLNGVSAELLVNVDQHSVPLIRRHADPLWRGRRRDLGYIAHTDRRPALGLHHHVADLVRIEQARVREDEEQLAPVLQLPGRGQDISPTHCCSEVVERKAVRPQLGRIGKDPVFARGAALIGDAGDAGHGRQHRGEGAVRKPPQLHRRRRCRGQAVGCDGEDGGIHPPYVEHHALGQRLLCARHGGLDALERQVHVRAPGEVHRQLRRSAAGGGA